MTDLLAGLQGALADRYTIERELGHGGMATVYLAQDRKHRRPVAIKVLKPELAAALGPERFLREIETAARLNHPHILPLHDSGEAAGFLYYVMPYVEGESLRDRLKRELRLPLDEALQIAREVADALSYAHSHHIVHRDIKPENVLLWRNHALLSDFGVAKAVTEPNAQAALTATGIVLGTPGYMAPEQAAADPTTDHRADLYALGALCYEMLTGRPAFTGTSPLAVFAAQVTQAPEPITRRRADVPSVLASLVMRCLETKPGDRFQSAEEVLAQLEAMTTLSGSEAAIRRAHPVSVAALFTAASVVVLTVVYMLMRGLGLPDWVLLSAAGLLLVGLPIMVFTGLVERRRALARSTGRVEPSTPRGLHRWLTWRKAFLGGAVAFAALGFGTAVYMAMRLLGVGPVGTLVASGLVREREPLLLADFVNRTPDSTLGPTLTEALRVDLAQSPTVRLVDARSIAGALGRMKRPLSTPLALTPDLARELAERMGTKIVVSSQIDPVDRGYALSVSVLSAADGQVLTAARATASDGAHLIGALDRLSRDLRERIGESLRTIRAGAPLEHVTTGSLEALRRYSEAARAEYSGDLERAATLYEEATTIDTSFAMAYRKLAVALTRSLASPDRIIAATKRGFALRDRLPDIERYLAIAFYYETVDYDPTNVVAAYRSVLERDPDNTTALNNLSQQLSFMRQFQAAESLAVRATSLGTSGARYINAIRAQVAQGHFADAETTLARFARVAPHSPDVLHIRALLASAEGAYPAAAQAARALRDEQQSDIAWKVEATFILASLDALRGRLSRAELEFEHLMALNEQRGLRLSYLLDVLALAEIDLRFRRQPTEGLRRVEAALSRRPLATIPPPDRPYVALSSYYARAGRLGEAEHLLAEYERTVPEGIRRRHPERHGAEGDLLLARGQIAEAIARYQAWYEARFSENEGSFEMATAYELAHTPDSALTFFERFAATPGLFRFYDDALKLAATYKRLGELYADRDRARALQYYGRFVDLWKDADPELQPVVRDVRGRVARLASEH